MSNIYGVDTTKEVNPEMVRSAIISCFAEAHCKQMELEGDMSLSKRYCTQIVKKAFTETGGDFDKPTKDSVIAVLPWLAEFSKSFRDQTVVQKHMMEIQALVAFVK